MSDFSTRITTLVDASAPPIDIDGLARQLESDTETLGVRRVVPQRRATNWLVAVGAAIVVFVLIGGSLWLIGGNGSDVVEEPTTTVAVETPTTVPEVTTTTTTPPIPSEALVIPVVPSQAPPADQGPLDWRWDPTAGGGFDATGEWRWDSNAGGAFDTTDLQRPVTGWYCYGSGGDRSTVVEFDGGSIKFQLGYLRAPEIVATDTEGTSTNVGNPFGDQAWLCSVAASDTHLLAVGSSVWWSADGVAWTGVEEFEQFQEVDYRNVDGSNLMWAAAGPSGYMVLGRANFSELAPIGERVGWYSGDFETWYEIPVEDGRLYEGWDWVGPTGIAVGNEPVVAMYDGAWIATRP